MLTIPNQLEGAYVGQNVTLECQTEAYPVSINYWTTEWGDMIISGESEHPLTPRPVVALMQAPLLQTPPPPRVQGTSTRQSPVATGTSSTCA